MAKLKYIVFNNDKYGSWTILDAKPVRSLARCICGLERIVRNADLISGRSRSCGKRVCFSDYKNLLDQKFGFLTVIKETENRASNGSIYWSCRCVCGNIIDVSSKRLISGATKSCGCKRYELRAAKISTLPANERAINKIYDSYQRGAKGRGIEFKLSKLEFEILIKDNCYYCGAPPQKVVIIKRLLDVIEYSHNGIDRIDSNLNYTIDNCVPCCWMCNRAKWNLPVDDFIKWIDQLILFRTGDN